MCCYWSKHWYFVNDLMQVVKRLKIQNNENFQTNVIETNICILVFKVNMVDNNIYIGGFYAINNILSWYVFAKN